MIAMAPEISTIGPDDRREQLSLEAIRAAYVLASKCASRVVATSLDPITTWPVAERGILSSSCVIGIPSHLNITLEGPSRTVVWKWETRKQHRLSSLLLSAWQRMWSHHGPEEQTKDIGAWSGNVSFCLFDPDAFVSSNLQRLATSNLGGGFWSLVAGAVVDDAKQWAKPCEEMFEYLAEHKPGRLAELVSGSLLTSGDLQLGSVAVGRKLTNAELSFAAEAAGRIEDPDLAVTALLALLSHPAAPVREGAIYGIQRHLESSEEGRSTLRVLAASDASPAVKRAAADALDVAA